MLTTIVDFYAEFYFLVLYYFFAGICLKTYYKSSNFEVAIAL